MRSRRTTSSSVVAAALAVALTTGVVGLTVPVGAVGVTIGPDGALHVAEAGLGQISRIDRKVTGPMKNLLSYEQRLAESAADMGQKHAYAAGQIAAASAAANRSG